MNKYHYTVQKLTGAIDLLVTHPGDARARIADAYLCIKTLTEIDFPEKDRQKWLGLISDLTKCGPIIGSDGEILTGSVENTMRHRQNRTAAKLCKTLYELYWAVSENKQYL